METLRKIIAGICAILFVTSGVITLLAFNIEQKAFASATYKQAFENQNLYEHMPTILANAVHTSIAGNANADPYLKPLTVADWEKNISSLLPSAELKTLTDHTLDSIFDYMNGNADSAVISLLPFKTHLAGDSGVEVVKQILRVQPTCTAEQLLQLGLGFLSGDIGLCNPPEQLMGLLTPLIESQLQVMTITIPDEVTIISGARSNTPEDPRVKLNSVRAVMKITPFFPLAFLFGISAFAIRSLVDWLKWWGYPFLVTGAISALIAWIGSPTLGFVIQRVLQSQVSSSMPPILFSTLRETVSTVAGQILEPVAIEGAILAASGLIMVLVAMYVARRR